MLRALVVVCLLGTSTTAAPKYDRAAIATTDTGLIAAEKAWTAAAGEKDPAKQVAAWEAAAAAFIQVVDAGVVAKGLQKDAAYAAILAWKNALAVDPRIVKDAATDRDFDRVPTPQPLDARDQALVHAIEVYLTLAPPPDEAAAAKFLRANVLRRREHLDKAIAGFLDILETHRDHEVAEYAANLVLDSYNRLQRYDDMVIFTTKLRADRKFLATRPELAETTRRILLVAARRETDTLVRSATEARDLGAFDRCGERYLELLGDPGLGPTEAEEVRYNAAVCFEQGGSIARAVATHRALIKAHPRSPLAGRAVARIANAEARVAHYREAAEAIEQYVERYPGEKDALAAASDGVLYAVASGELARAARLADLAISRFGAKRPLLVAETTVVVIEGQLAAGKRKDALQRARAIANKDALQRLRDPGLALRAGRALAAAACPAPALGERCVASHDRALAGAACRVPVADELCPKPRDRALVAAARQLLASAGDHATRRPSDIPSAETAPIADHATRLALDLELEAVLATRKPAASVSEPVVRGYERLLADARVPEVRVAANARLGTLYRHTGDRDRALLALRACVTDARATQSGSSWLARCERDLAALREPDLDLLPERLAPPTASAPIVVEQPR